jgi:hypothetical protein
MTELKPCPFCGREPVYVADGKVICICGAMMQSFNEWKPFTEQEAIDRWNKRISCDTCAMYYPDDGCMAGLAEGEVE